MLKGLRSPRRTGARLAVLAFLLVGAVSGAIAAQVSPASEGQALFTKYCIGCHTVGGGVTVGPDLKGITDRQDQSWLVKWIMDPPAMVAAKDPAALALTKQFPAIVMPSLGLKQTEVESIVAYLATTGEGAGSGASNGAAPAGKAAAAPAPALVGDVVRGQDLFTGRSRFTNGGPACIACHSVSGIGALGGGQLGPDLTAAAGKYGGTAGLTGFLANPPTKTMSVIWGAQPSTDQERADVAAFLDQVSVAGRPANSILQLLGLAIAGTAVLLFVVWFIWRGRLRGVRRPMVAGFGRGR